MQAGTRLLHVPYKGSAPAMSDLLGGQVQLMFSDAPTALPQIKAGKVRAIAVASVRRSVLLPDVPTVAESGVPGCRATRPIRGRLSWRRPARRRTSCTS
jgi:tripartite-type tricarboxylate transporter receptor subunit TctC